MTGYPRQLDREYLSCRSGGFNKIQMVDGGTHPWRPPHCEATAFTVTNPLGHTRGHPHLDRLTLCRHRRRLSFSLAHVSPAVPSALQSPACARGATSQAHRASVSAASP